MHRMVVTAFAAAFLSACFTATLPEGDAGLVPAADGGAPQTCLTSEDCPAGDHCDVVLDSCGGAGNRSILVSSQCTHPPCGSACLGESCASDDECAADQTCDTYGPAFHCATPCCQAWGRCAAMPNCAADCIAIWPPHESCFACVCPTCEAPAPDAGEPTPGDAGGGNSPDAGGEGDEDAGTPQGCLTSADCPAGEHCDVVLAGCGAGGDSVLVSSKCTRPACGEACLGQPCASNEECAGDQTCGTGSPGGPNCSSPCCQDWGRCTAEPNCRAGCTAIWPAHGSCFACVCPSCDAPDGG